MIPRCQPLSGHGLLFWEGTLVESMKCGMASQGVEIVPSGQFFVFVRGFVSTMRCTCLDLSHASRISALILHLPLVISETTQNN
jgi:hypothetical protein